MHAVVHAVSQTLGQLSASRLSNIILTQHLPRQSRSVINSARAMEFDYVPFEQLKQLAACLRRHASQDSFEAPPEDDHDWWEDAAVEAGLSAGMGVSRVRFKQAGDLARR